MAPESLESRMFSQKSDVWSYGVTLFEVFNFGDAPYSGDAVSNSLRDFILLLKSGYKLECPVDTPRDM